MKDETKEELDDLLSKNQNKLLLDCVIKLQKENEKLKHSLWEQQEKNEYLRDKIDKLNNYIEKMSYCEVVDNPKKELSRILEKGE